MTDLLRELNLELTVRETNELAEEILRPLGLTQTAIPQEDRDRWTIEVSQIIDARVSAILRERVKGAALVYGPQSFWGLEQGTQNSWHTYKNFGHTHSAYLLGVKKLEA